MNYNYRDQKYNENQANYYRSNYHNTGFVRKAKKSPGYKYIPQPNNYNIEKDKMSGSLNNFVEK